MTLSWFIPENVQKQEKDSIRTWKSEVARVRDTIIQHKHGQLTCVMMELELRSNKEYERWSRTDFNPNWSVNKTRKNGVVRINIDAGGRFKNRFALINVTSAAVSLLTWAKEILKSEFWLSNVVNLTAIEPEEQEKSKFKTRKSLRKSYSIFDRKSELTLNLMKARSDFLAGDARWTRWRSITCETVEKT